MAARAERMVSARARFSFFCVRLASSACSTESRRSVKRARASRSFSRSDKIARRTGAGGIGATDDVDELTLGAESVVGAAALDVAGVDTRGVGAAAATEEGAEEDEEGDDEETAAAAAAGAAVVLFSAASSDGLDEDDDDDASAAEGLAAVVDEKSLAEADGSVVADSFNVDDGVLPRSDERELELSEPRR